MKDRNNQDRSNQDRSIPRHNEEKNREGFRGSSKESNRTDQSQGTRDDIERNRSDRGSNRSR